MSPRRGTALALTLSLAAGLAGCGGDPEEAYCETLREESRVLQDLAEQAEEPGNDVLVPTYESLQRLQDDAPAQLQDEYTTYVNAWEGMVDAVDQSGVDPSQFRPGKVPRGVDPAAARLLSQTAAELASPRVLDAVRGIEDHAQQVCDVDFAQ